MCMREKEREREISIYLPNWSFLYNMALCPWESELRKNRVAATER